MQNTFFSCLQTIILELTISITAVVPVVEEKVQDVIVPEPIVVQEPIVLQEQVVVQEPATVYGSRKFFIIIRM